MKKSTVILTIDTSKASSLMVSVTVGSIEFIKHENTGLLRSVRLLPLCLEVLTEHNLSWKDITAINVVNKKGSITGLRVGFAVSNTLGFLLGVSVNGLPAIENVHPLYDSTYLDTFDKASTVSSAESLSVNPESIEWVDKSSK